MEIKYCWRCKAEVPLLSEDEWKELSPILDNMVLRIKQFRESNGCNLKSAQLAVGNEVLEIYNRITGFKETNYLAVWHHRRSFFGSECKSCGFLLRTPKAKYCANCGGEK